MQPVWILIDKDGKAVICVCLTIEARDKAVAELGNIADVVMFYSYT